MLPPSGLFITGTDTNIGKTHVAALIVRALRREGHRVGAYKPVCSGATTDPDGRPSWDDIFRLRAALGVTYSDELICPQRFLAPLAPPMAAAAEGRTVDFQQLVQGASAWSKLADLLVVEGAGGLLAPVAETKTVADLAVEIGYPLVIVARFGLGTINHTLLTIEAAQRRGLTVAGIVLNQHQPSDDLSLAEANAAAIETYSGVRVLGIVNWGEVDGLHRHGRPVTIPWSELA
jgi:dethiobiotin synthetase